MLRSLLIYLILHLQYSFYEASPLIGEDVRQAELNELPFVVSICLKPTDEIPRRNSEQIAKSHFCGGSLITINHVLTAAHCDISNQCADRLVVRIGAFDLADSKPYDIEKWTNYSQWTTEDLPANPDCIHDIAVVKIRGTVTDIKLPSISYTPIEKLYGESVIISGWGLTKFECNQKIMISRFMRIANFKVMRSEECLYFTKEPDPLLRNLMQEKWLCTTSSAPGTSTTRGDSGGPLLLSDQNTIIGVHGKGSYPKKPYISLAISVYTYQKFIEEMKEK